MSQINLYSPSSSKWIIDTISPWTLLEKDDSCYKSTGKCLLGLSTHLVTIPIALLESTVALTFLSIAKGIEFGVSCILSKKCFTWLSANIVDPLSRYTFSAITHLAIAISRIYTNFFEKTKAEKTEAAIPEILCSLQAFLALVGSTSILENLLEANEKIPSKKATCDEIQLYIKTAKSQGRNRNPLIRAIAMHTLAELVLCDYKEAFEPALEAALGAKDDKYGPVRFQAIITLNYLIVRHEPAIAHAIKESLAAKDDQHASVRTLAISNLASVVEKNHQEAYQPALEAALVAKDDSDASIRACALSTLRWLADKNHQPAFERSLQASVVAKNDPDVHVRKEAISILYSLTRTNHQPAYQPAIETALDNINSQNLEIKELAFNTLIALINRGQGDADELTVARNHLQVLRARPNPPAQDITHLQAALMSRSRLPKFVARLVI